MRVNIGKSFPIKLNDEKVLDVTVYTKKWVTLVEMSVWENDIMVRNSKKRYINLEKFISKDLAKSISLFLLNIQSKRVAGIKIF